MIVLVSKKTDPLFIEFDVKDVEENLSVMFLWEDDLYKSLLHSDLAQLKNNVIYFSSINKPLNFFKNEVSFKIVSLKNHEVIFEYKFINTSFIEGNKINYISQNNTTGYAYAARNHIFQLLNENFDVYWNVSKFYKSTYVTSNEYEKRVEFRLDKTIRDNYYDTCIVHATPNDWGRIIKTEDSTCNKLLGMTVWETTKLKKDWVDAINSSPVHEIIVPSQFNLEIFKNSGITKTINVWRHQIFPIEYEKLLSVETLSKNFRLFRSGKFIKDKFEIENILKTKTVYYNISQYNERKNIDQIIKTFCTRFSKDDKVCLFIKTYIKEVVPSQIEYLKFKFASLVKGFINPPDLIFCFTESNDLEIQSIHHNFDVYFTLNRGEGFGLCSYTAKKFGNKVICGKFGAEKEFLDNTDILIDYELVPTFNMHLFHNYYDSSDQFWASYKDSDVLKVLEYIPKKSK
jgi:hypothetical protein